MTTTPQLSALLRSATLAAALLGLPAAAMASDASQPVTDAARAGERVQLPALDFAAIPRLDATIRDADSPQLLLSDKPEYFRTGNGIAMQEAVEPGDVRLYLYHVPTPDAGPKQIAATIENLGDGPMRVRFRKASLNGPGGDYHKLGKDGQIELLAEDDPAATNLDFELPAGERRLVDARLGSLNSKTNDLLHGIYVFTIDQPARITTLQADPGADAAAMVEELPKLPQVLPGHHASGAGRGLFATGANKEVTADSYDTADGPRQIIFADGEIESWISGVDSLAGEDPALGEAEPQNKGNYGVIYRLRIPYTSSDGRGVSLVTYNARAGARWCEKAAVAVRVLGDNGLLPTDESGSVPLPNDQVRYGGPPEGVVIQHFPAAPEGGEIELLYTPPGASCLPVPFVLIPLDNTNN